VSSTDTLLTPAEAAAYLRLTAGQLKQWRYLGKGPAYAKAGRAVRYWRSDLDAWLARQRIEPPNEP
jgi:excisionase family DNA binding protein